jgi:hypothetical protein
VVKAAMREVKGHFEEILESALVCVSVETFLRLKRDESHRDLQLIPPLLFHLFIEYSSSCL